MVPLARLLGWYFVDTNLVACNQVTSAFLTLC